jgi:MFS family permease
MPGIHMIDARIEPATDGTEALPWAQRLATLGVFVANGLGIGAWAAAIPRVKSDLALSDATLSAALLSFAAGAIVAMPLMGLFAHRLRSGPASVVAGFAFAAALAALGFARSLESLSAARRFAGRVARGNGNGFGPVGSSFALVAVCRRRPTVSRA